ncbi:ChbG/HpnK family deacetylase [Sphingomonas sp. Leaf21]|uniref:ChbG/HpnK family deacetylase n=1 Tax=Sphingomonas sp. Leaf21 TaxID=2876550 RepID=UPI001E5AB533|nr:ChbG/HpnK family deacetylase [Sphingomonas sp. Leaf21]
MNRLILCADDFAFSTDDSRVIAELLRAGKLNATSCMTLRPNWAEDSAMLRDLPDTVQIGLHLTLTEEAPILPNGFTRDGVMPGIDPLTRLAARDRLDAAEIVREVEAQFDRFEAAMGRPPAFVDGHQHAHALPGIRSIVLAITRHRAPAAWLRTCEDRAVALLARPWRGKAIGSAWHSRGLAASAKASGLRCNRGFAGHYGFDGRFAQALPRFLDRAGPDHLVMCHPGAGTRTGDAIAAARRDEADVLRAVSISDMAARRGLAFAA